MTRLLNLWLFVAGGIVGAALLAPSAPAWAHVNAGSTSTGDGLTVVRFSFTHGCGESPTTSLRVQIPANASDVTADENPGWTSSVTSTEIRWTGGTAPDGTKTTFSATMKLAGQGGETVFFPTLQGCVEGENTWIAKSDDPEADDAAPRITLDVTTPSDEPDETADPGGGSSATSSTAVATTVSPTTTQAGTATSNDSNAPIIGLVIVGVLVSCGAAGALFVRRRGV